MAKRKTTNVGKAITKAKRAVTTFKVKDGKDMAILVTTGGLVLTGVFFGGRAVIRNIRGNWKEKRSLNDTNPEYYARKIHEALQNSGWWWGQGTNEDLLFLTLEEIPDDGRTMDKVVKSYRKMYNSSLIEDIDKERELWGDKGIRAKAIIESKT